MMKCRLFLIFLPAILLVSILNAERARDVNFQDEENLLNISDDEDVIETVKRLLFKKTTTTTVKPSFNVIGELIPTSPRNKLKTTSKSSIYGGDDGKKFNLACGDENPCQNGGRCRTLSSGRRYCSCTDQYYGKNCEKKFRSTDSNNNSQTKKDHCASSPCLHSSECIPLRTTFYCRCKKPYYGITCNKVLSKREEIVDESNTSEDEFDL